MHRTFRIDVVGCLASAWFAQVACDTLLQAQEIRVGVPTLVARGSPAQPRIQEPHLVVHPANPSHFLAAAMVGSAAASFDEREKEQGCACFLSLDAGKTWVRHDFPLTRCVDPWLAIAPDGQATFTALGIHPAVTQLGRPGPYEGLVAFHSPDGGRTWDEKAIGLGRGHDHPTIAVDQISPSRKGWLYVVSHRSIRADNGTERSAVFVARSRDGGKNFDEPVNVVPNSLENLAENAAVLSDGTLLVSFVDAGYRSENPKGGDFERRRAWVIRSNDGGSSFSIPLFANDACGPPPSFRLSAFLADTSPGPFRDRLYFACRQKGSGPIVLNYSKDRGEVWSEPVAVHSVPGGVMAAERIPGLAVNEQGVLAVAWIDGRDDLSNGCEMEVRFTASTDGGQTFLPEQRVASVPPCPDPPGYLHPTGGDYFGMAATPDGRFHIVWSERRGGASELRTTTVEIPAGASDRK